MFDFLFWNRDKEVQSLAEVIAVDLTKLNLSRLEIEKAVLMIAKAIVGLQGQVAAGEENIPWHTSDEEEHCKFYSNADMARITTTAMSHVTWHVTYFRDLRIYIRSLEDKEEVEKVTYGMDIPVEYQSEPLKAMIAAQSV